MKSYLAFCGALLTSVSSAAASDYLVLSPTPAVVQTQRVLTYYGAPAVVAPTTTYYAPMGATSYYAPAPAATTTYYAPAPVVSGALPVTTYYAPTISAQPVTTYYTPSVATPVVTYYGATAAVAPAYIAPAPVLYGSPAIVRSKVYYPGEPIRNFFRAITP